MKRFLATMMALVLLVCAVPLTALAERWLCPECWTYNVDRMFCSTCGTLYPKFSDSGSTTNNTTSSSTTSSGTFKISSVYRSSSTGYVNVSWTDTRNNGPYYVSYYQGDNSFNTMSENASSNVYGTSCSLRCLCPGSTYTIMVTDKSGNRCKYTYTESGVTDFKEFTVSIGIQLKSRKNGTTKNISSFSVRDIENRPAYEWGYYVRVNHNNLSYDRTHNVLFVVKDPNGFVISSQYVDNNSFKSRYSYTYWEFIDITDAFDRAGNKYGFIPTGEYRVIVYLDGKRAGRKNFKVEY